MLALPEVLKQKFRCIIFFSKIYGHLHNYLKDVMLRNFIPPPKKKHMAQAYGKYTKRKLKNVVQNEGEVW